MDREHHMARYAGIPVAVGVAREVPGEHRVAPGPSDREHDRRTLLPRGLPLYQGHPGHLEVSAQEAS